MEIYLRTSDEYLDEYGGPISDSELAQVIDDYDGIDVERAVTVNVGPGADIIVILAVINTVIDALLIWDKLETVVSQLRKLADWIRSKKEKRLLWSIDEIGVSALAVQYIAQCEGEIMELSRLDSHAFDLSSMEIYKYYVQSYLVNNEKIFIIGCDSDGNLQELGIYDSINNYGPIHKKARYRQK